jgi:hypothetical protein
MKTYVGKAIKFIVNIFSIIIGTVYRMSMEQLKNFVKKCIFLLDLSKKKNRQSFSNVQNQEKEKMRDIYFSMKGNISFRKTHKNNVRYYQKKVCKFLE